MSLKDAAYQRIKDDILEQRVLPNEPLVEAELAERYGMSKTPVREALLALASDGLVDVSARRGVRVRNFTPDDIREIYELRALIEPPALEWSVKEIGAQQIARLQELMAEAEAAAARNAFSELSRINREFHRLLIADCGNERVVQLIDNLQDQLRMIALVAWAAGASYSRDHEQHLAIVHALEDGDVEQAGVALRAHIEDFYQQCSEGFGPTTAEERATARF